MGQRGTAQRKPREMRRNLAEVGGGYPTEIYQLASSFTKLKHNVGVVTDVCVVYDAVSNVFMCNEGKENKSWGLSREIQNKP